jgi:glycosyltransferase involved in cell wall biosynthesis
MDGRSALPRRDGLGTYISEVMPRVAAAEDFRPTILINPKMVDFWRAQAPRAVLVPSTCPAMGVTQQWRVSRVVRALRPDLYFYPAHDPPAGVSVPFVMTVHDLTVHLVRPYFESADRLKRGYLRVVTGVGLRRAARVIVASEATRGAVGQVFGRDLLGKVHVTLYATGRTTSGGETAAGRRRHLLYVGTDRPHKNLDRLIAAYAKARVARSDLPCLELVGGLRRGDRLRQRIVREGVDEAVILRGHVSDDELQEAYDRAIALVMPSLAEGFGLPIIEAMAQGIPVVTSDRSACAEVAGGAALLIDPESVESLADALLAVSTDDRLRDRLAVLGRSRAAEFSWDRCAAGTLDVIRAAVASR